MIKKHILGENSQIHKIIISFSFSGILQSLIIFLYIFFATRNLDIENYAFLRKLFYYIDFSTALSLLGLNLLLLRESKLFFIKYFLSIVIISLLVSLVFNLFTIFSMNISFIEKLLGLLISLANVIYQYIIFSLIKFKQNKNLLIITSSNFFFTILLLYYYSEINFTLLNILKIRLFLTILIILFFIYITKSNIILLNKINIKKIFFVIKKNKFISASILIGLITSYVDKFFAINFLSEKLFSYYSTMSLDIPFIGIIISNYSLYFIEELKKAKSATNITKCESIIKRIFLFGIYFNFIVFTLLFINSKLYITIFFSNSMIYGNTIFRILLLGLIFKITIYTNILISLKIEHVILKRMIVEFIFQLVMSFILSSYFGPNGLAISVILVLCFWSVPYNIFYISRSLSKRITNILPVQQLFTISIKSVILISICSIANNFISNIYLLFIISLILGIIIYYYEINYLIKNFQ